MERLLTSRKMWGAVLGSISIMGVMLIGGAHVAAAITTLGILWGAAIGGQAIRDYKVAKQE